MLVLQHGTIIRDIEINFLIKILLSNEDEFYLVKNGRPYTLVDIYDDIKHGKDTSTPIKVLQRIYGGKGGFGSMLRSMGSKMEKNRNKDACRGLDGRRLRDTTIENRIKEHKEKTNILTVNETLDKSKKKRTKLEKYISQEKVKGCTDDIKDVDKYMDNIKKSSNIIFDSVVSSLKVKDNITTIPHYVGKNTCERKKNILVPFDSVETRDYSSCTNISVSDIDDIEIY